MHTRQNPKRGEPTISTMIGIGVLTLVSFTLLLAILVRIVPSFEPSVGEMAVFSVQQLTNGIQTRTAQVAVTNRWGDPISDARCVLASEVMDTAGGSLVVETRLVGTDPTYVVHWVGGPTSGGTSDCGSDVDVLVAKEDLIGLLAPGGFGVRREAK
jgi:hypothetical protein